MKLYQLEDKNQDLEFLAGKRVRCRAVLHGVDDTVKGGDFILVVLSNGKKYKGKVERFESFRLNEFEIGELVITRVG